MNAREEIIAERLIAYRSLTLCASNPTEQILPEGHADFIMSDENGGAGMEGEANLAGKFPGSIAQIHKRACKAKQNHYIDPTTGYKVLTEFYLLKRGFCCSSGCRHCPYEYLQ